MNALRKMIRDCIEDHNFHHNGKDVTSDVLDEFDKMCDLENLYQEALFHINERRKDYEDLVKDGDFTVGVLNALFGEGWLDWPSPYTYDSGLQKIARLVDLELGIDALLSQLHDEHRSVSQFLLHIRQYDGSEQTIDNTVGYLAGLDYCQHLIGKAGQPE